MATIQTNLTCELQNGSVAVQYLNGVLFTQDVQGNQINVAVYDGGEPATISGTVSGNVIRSDGGTVAVTGGSISGNVASITLPAAAYAVPGVASIIVKLSTSGVVTTLAAVVANIYESSTSTAVDPGTVIPSIQTLINQINTAVASIPADYSTLWTTLAPAFSTSTTYAAGQYVTYNGGLYKFTAAHTGNWSASDVVAANIGNDLSDLKTAIINILSKEEVTLTLSQGGITTTTGVANQSDKRVRTQLISCPIGFELYLPTNVYATVFYYDTSNNNEYIGYKKYAGKTIYPSGAVRIVYYIGDGTTDITPSDVSDVKFYNYMTIAETVPQIANSILEPYDETLKETRNIRSLFKYPYKIQTNVGIGNTVNPIPTSESACACICYPCLKGDKFTLTGTGYSSISLWAFTDTEYKLLSIRNGSGKETNTVHIAQQDGYFICNVNTNSTYALSVYTFKDFSGLDRFDSLFPKSRFYKPISWGASDLDNYIHVNNGDFDLFTGNTTASQYYQLWNDLTTASNGYITATELGLASDNATTMYAYDLKPIAGYVGPKLFIVCGQHGFEKAGPFGLYYFVRELVNNYRNNPTLMYLRNWCRMIIIPLMNPYGFNNNVYTNANGVNLNRNWPTSEWSAGTSGTTNYGGSSAGSEVETQYAVSLFTTHSDSLILTDIHTNGQTAVSNYVSVMWQAFETEINEDEYSKLCVEAAKKEINDLSSAFCIDYSEDVPSYTQIGHYSLDSATGGLATIYAREHDMLAETVEGFPAWPGGTTYKPSCHQANADIFGNWFRCVLAVYERLGGNKYNAS